MKSTTAHKSGASVKALTSEPVRPRITFRFQLDIGRDNVEFFSQLQKYLAAKKSWKRYAMDGLRLIYDLKNGSTAVLLELFPNIRDMLGQGCGDTNDMLREILDNQRKLLERGITDASIPQTPLAALPANGGPKPLNAPTFAMPTWDDEDDVKIETRRDTSNSAVNNFMKAMSSLH